VVGDLRWRKRSDGDYERRLGFVLLSVTWRVQGWSWRVSIPARFGGLILASTPNRIPDLCADVATAKRTAEDKARELLGPAVGALFGPRELAVKGAAARRRENG
jgi:hypothetical protein